MAGLWCFSVYIIKKIKNKKGFFLAQLKICIIFDPHRPIGQKGQKKVFLRYRKSF